MVGKSFEKRVKARKIGLEKALESGGRLEHVYTSREKGVKRGALQTWGEEDVPRSKFQRWTAWVDLHLFSDPNGMEALMNTRFNRYQTL